MHAPHRARRRPSCSPSHPCCLVWGELRSAQLTPFPSRMGQGGTRSGLPSTLSPDGVLPNPPRGFPARTTLGQKEGDVPGEGLAVPLRMSPGF